MKTYLAKRLFFMIPTIFCVASLVFALLHFVPGDPVDLLIGEQALSADRELLREQLGLNRPLLIQYGNFFKGLVTGDLGNSLFDSRPVLAHLGERYGATVELALASLIVSLMIAFPFGILASVKKYSWIDHFSMAGSMVGISMPNFWLGPMLILFFSVKLGWLPVAGRESFSSIILPALTLGAAMAALLTRMIRASMLDVLGQDYIRAARAKGLKERDVILKHAVKNAMNPVITVIGLQVGTLLAGAVVTERVFNWPGVGSLLIESIGRRDYPVVQGCVLFIAATYIVVNTLTDCLYKVLEPRVRLG